MLARRTAHQTNSGQDSEFQFVGGGSHTAWICRRKEESSVTDSEVSVVVGYVIMDTLRTFAALSSTNTVRLSVRCFSMWLIYHDIASALLYPAVMMLELRPNRTPSPMSNISVSSFNNMFISFEVHPAWCPASSTRRIRSLFPLASVQQPSSLNWKKQNHCNQSIPENRHLRVVP